jgi:hypothetical protein
MQWATPGSRRYIVTDNTKLTNAVDLTALVSFLFFCKYIHPRT